MKSNTKLFLSLVVALFATITFAECSKSFMKKSLENNGK